MRTELGICIVEKGGQIQTQAYAKPDEALTLFREMVGSPADDPWRATFVTLRWVDGKLESSAESRDLPKKKDDSWGWRLGSGPMEKPKESQDGTSGKT